MNQWLPVFINVFINKSFRPYIIVIVLGLPAGDHRVGGRDPEVAEQPRGLTQVEPTRDGDTANGKAKFTSDGVYALYDPNDDEPQLGRFAYANGMLWLITADSKAFFRLDWLNSDSFSFTIDGIKVSFDR